GSRDGPPLWPIVAAVGARPHLMISGGGRLSPATKGGRGPLLQPRSYRSPMCRVRLLRFPTCLCRSREPLALPPGEPEVRAPCLITGPNYRALRPPNGPRAI